MRYNPKQGRWELLAAAVLVCVFVGGALAQSAWQIEPIAPAAGMKVAPAIVFDSQDRAQVVYSTDALYLQYSRANQAGAAPVWAAAPGQSTGAWNSYGQQVFLAVAGDTVYVGCNGTSGFVFRNYAAVFNGTAWTELPTFLPNSAGIFGVVGDVYGQVHWLLSAQGNFDTARGIDTSGYYLLNGTSPTAAALKVAPGVSAFPPKILSPDVAAMHTGGQMVSDPNGNLQTIQYYENGAQGVLLYAGGPASGPFAVTDGFDDGWQVKMGPPSIALDRAGHAHVACAQQWPSYGVKYVAWNGSSWDSEWVEQGGNMFGYLGTFPHVIVDKAGAVHVIYADLFNGLLKHAVKTPAGWQIETIDQIGTQLISGLMAGSLAAAMDSTAGIGVAYWSGKDFMLKYAYLATTVPGDVNGDGHVDVVDLLCMIESFGLCQGDPGYDPRCDLDGSGCVDIVDLLAMVANWDL